MYPDIAKGPVGHIVAKMLGEDFRDTGITPIGTNLDRCSRLHTITSGGEGLTQLITTGSPSGRIIETFVASKQPVRPRQISATPNTDCINQIGLVRQG